MQLFKKNNTAYLLESNPEWEKLIKFVFICPDLPTDQKKSLALVRQWGQFGQQFLALAIPGNMNPQIEKALRELCIKKIQELLFDPLFGMQQLPNKVTYFAETIADFLIYALKFTKKVQPDVQIETISAQPFTTKEKALVAAYDEIIRYPIPGNLLRMTSIILFRAGLPPLFNDILQAIRKENPKPKHAPVPYARRERWYSDEHIDPLFEQLFRGNAHVRLLGATLGTDYNGINFLREKLHQYIQERQKTINQDNTEHKQVLIPVNLAESDALGIHWVLLYLYYPSGSEIVSQIIYVDPFGKPMPQVIAYHLNVLFPTAECAANSICLQNDKDSCGPWITALAPLLIRDAVELANKTLTVSDIMRGLQGKDIEVEREVQENCLENPNLYYTSTFLTASVNSPLLENTHSPVNGMRSKFKELTLNVQKGFNALQLGEILKVLIEPPILLLPPPIDIWPQVRKICLQAQEFFTEQDILSTAFLEFSTAIYKLNSVNSMALKTGLVVALKTALNHDHEEGEFIFKHHLAKFLFDAPITRDLIFEYSATDKIKPGLSPDESGAILIQHLHREFRGNPVASSTPAKLLECS